MALCLASLLVALVLATAARPPAKRVAAAKAPTVQKSEERLLADQSSDTVRPKASPRQVWLSSSTRLSKAEVWGYGAAYDLDLTSRASIYVVYTPAEGK